jgi:SulP family sulfate permease
LRCKQIAEAHQATLVMTAVPKDIQQQMDLSGFFEDKKCVCFHPDLDRGLEWCEDRIIADAGLTINIGPTSLKDWLAAGGMQKNHFNRLLIYLERVEIGEGEYLIHQGEEAEDMYFIERGQVSIFLEHEGGKRTRLRTMDTGTMVGEIGMFLAIRRTASVIADEPCIAYRLTKTSLARMKKRDPDLAASFHEMAVKLLANRLTDTNLLVSALRR